MLSPPTILHSTAQPAIIRTPSPSFSPFPHPFPLLCSLLHLTVLSTILIPLATSPSPYHLPYPLLSVEGKCGVTWNTRHTWLPLEVPLVIVLLQLCNHWGERAAAVQRSQQRTATKGCDIANITSKKNINQNASEAACVSKQKIQLLLSTASLPSHCSSPSYIPLITIIFFLNISNNADYSLQVTGFTTTCSVPCIPLISNFTCPHFQSLSSTHLREIEKMNRRKRGRENKGVPTRPLYNTLNGRGTIPLGVPLLGRFEGFESEPDSLPLELRWTTRLSSEPRW